MRFSFRSAFRAAAFGVLVAAQTTPVMAQQDPNQALHAWLLMRLMQPSPQELEQEQKGNVYIYDGLSEREVDSALDQNFGRIQAMMFVGTLKSDSSGQPLRDAATGKVIEESGGCSSPE
jgi:hypothetical protein